MKTPVYQTKDCNHAPECLDLNECGNYATCPCVCHDRKGWDVWSKGTTEIEDDLCKLYSKMSGEPLEKVMSNMKELRRLRALPKTAL